MDVKIDEALWATALLPEGTIERWLVASESPVKAGQKIAEVKIEDALHEIMALGSGRLNITAKAGSIIEPGSVVASIQPT